MTSVRRLPCTAFEELMLAQDSPAYPCIVFARVQIKGQLSLACVEKAASVVVHRHPLLRSRLNVHRRRLSWEAVDVPSPLVHYNDMQSESRHALTQEGAWLCHNYVDLRKETGFRILVEENDERSAIVFQCHHACADGLGLLLAIHEFWLSYHGLCTGALIDLPVRSPDWLRQRNRFGLNFMKLLRIAPKQFVGLAGVRQFLGRQPKPIVGHSPVTGNPPTPIPVHAVTQSFSREKTVALLAIAKRRQVTINDLMAHFIFVAVAQWRELHGEQSGGDWLRMMVPVNMRYSEMDRDQSACNVVSSVFLDRTPEQILDRPSLLQSIHEEMSLIKQNQLAFTFIASLCVNRLLRGIKTPGPSGRCQTTMVFTNLGKAYVGSPLRDAQNRLRAGDVVVEQIELLAPLAPWMSAAFSVVHYAEQLTLSLRYDRRFIHAAAAEQLLSGVITEAETMLAVTK